MGPDVTLISSAEQTARDLYRVLVENGLERPADANRPAHRFLATGDRASFAKLARRFLGPEVAHVQEIPAFGGTP